MKRLKEQQYFLKVLKNLNLKQRKHVLKFLSNDQLKLFVEIAFNLLHNNIPISEETHEKIKKNKKYLKKLRQLACNSVKLSDKKKILQSGGFIGTLLATVGATIVTQIIDHYLNKKEEEHEQ